MERGLGLAAWSQNAELGSCAPWARVQSTIAEGTQKEVWAHRSSKASLLGRSRGRVATTRGISFFVCAWTLECCIFEQWGPFCVGWG